MRFGFVGKFLEVKSMNLFKKKKDFPKCDLCQDGQRYIENISGFLMKSEYAIFNIGGTNEVNFCPRCGRPNKKVL